MNNLIWAAGWGIGKNSFTETGKDQQTTDISNRKLLHNQILTFVWTIPKKIPLKLEHATLRSDIFEGVPKLIQKVVAN